MAVFQLFIAKDFNMSSNQNVRGIKRCERAKKRVNDNRSTVVMNRIIQEQDEVVKRSKRARSEMRRTSRHGFGQGKYRTSRNFFIRLFIKLGINLDSPR